jgi:cytochrome c oxidase subunit 2
MTLPKGRHVKLDITSNDVIHSFWVPQFSQKQDAVPGQHNMLVITPDRLGTYPVICTELCGLGHALMRSHVDVVSPAAYAAWVKAGGKTTGPPGLAVFQQNGCAGCHTFKPANATGTVGPDLDNLQQEAQKANRGPEAAFVEESILKPQAYLEPGFSDAMPHIFASQIPKDKLQQLVQYLVKGP